MFGIAKQQLCKANHNQNAHRFNYCGTCKTLGSRYGHLSRFFLNHDVVFLAALLNGYHKQPITGRAYHKISCLSMPSKSEVPILFQYVASVNVFLASIKTRDNILDETSLSKLKWTSLQWLYLQQFQKAKRQLKHFGLPMNQIDSLLQKNHQNEQTQHLSLETYLYPTACITKTIFLHGAKMIGAKESFVNHMSAIGNQLGKLVYLIDARDDLSTDREKNAFNPILQSNQINLSIVNQAIDQTAKQINEGLEALPIPNDVKQRYQLQFSALPKKEQEQKKSKKKNKKKDSCFLDFCCYGDCDCSCCCSSNDYCCTQDSCCDCDCG